MTLGLQVEVDVPYTEYRDAQETVKSVMWPSETVMDLVSRVVSQPLPIRLIVGVESLDGFVLRSAWCWKSEKERDS